MYTKNCKRIHALPFRPINFQRIKDRKSGFIETFIVINTNDKYISEKNMKHIPLAMAENSIWVVEKSSAKSNSKTNVFVIFGCSNRAAYICNTIWNVAGVEFSVDVVWNFFEWKTVV